MKKIGLVGGIGSASTVEYYLGIIEKTYCSWENIYPEIVIDSVNMAQHKEAKFHTIELETLQKMAYEDNYEVHTLVLCGDVIKDSSPLQEWLQKYKSIR